MRILIGMVGLLTVMQTFGQTQIALQSAYWITAPDSVACPVFRKDIAILKPVKTINLIITAHGIYEAQFNGKKIGNAYFAPGFTSYEKRLQYQVYDITKLVKPGPNILTVTVSGGWFSGVFGGLMNSGNYGRDKSLLCSLVIIYKDGSKQKIQSDSSWQVGTGPVKYADFYAGEIQDTRIVSGEWSTVRTKRFTKTNLIPTMVPPVTAQESFTPRRQFTDPKGERLIDFGQNLAGFVRLKISGKAGDTLKISHAELLDKEGNFYTGNLREAKAMDVYVLNGKKQILQPHFIYHGFRYARLEWIRNGKDIPPPSEGWQAIAFAVHSALRYTGTFSCSDPLINQLQHNITWSLNSNFIDIPTDCPQRSERLGWTGDAAIFCRTAAFNRDVKSFYEKYLADLAADQGTNGGLPNIIPDVYTHDRKEHGGVAGWGDAATIIPWDLYQVYGDKKILKTQYASMKAWVDYVHHIVREQNPDSIALWKSNGYGDWYAMGDSTSLTFIDQCFFYRSATILAKTAGILQFRIDSAYCSKLADTIKSAFNQTYLFNTRATKTQTAYVLALAFDLLPEERRQQAADSLAKRIQENHNHLATGFLGTPFLLPVLSKYGLTALAYRLLEQTTCPSWLYPITKGATTIWERWDTERPDGSLQEASFNHYAYGAVGQWLYETIAGIKPASPGYKIIHIEPHPGGGLSSAKATYRCPYGQIVSAWQVKSNHIFYHISIPPHTTAEVILPGEKTKIINAGTHFFRTLIYTTNQLEQTK